MIINDKFKCLPFVIVRAGSSDDTRTMVKPKQFVYFFSLVLKKLTIFFFLVSYLL